MPRMCPACPPAPIKVPLHPCKAIKIDKSQGQSVGPNEVWKNSVVKFVAALRHNKTPGLECIAFLDQPL
jgi:hypothetical protein